MCVILYKKADKQIEDWRLESAVEVNPDGWGYCIPDGQGKLITRRSYDAKGNSAKAIAKTIEKNMTQEMYIHLRFKTQGDLNLANCHPFTILTHKKHGVDMQFMHNGSIPDFNDRKDPRSDTKQFVDTILIPLCEAILAYERHPEGVMYNELIADILEKYAGNHNKFVLVDGYGASLFINERHGKDFDWGWASNEYSFNRNHRKPATTTFPTHSNHPINHNWGDRQNNAPFPGKNGKTSQDTGVSEVRPPEVNGKGPNQQEIQAQLNHLETLNDRSTIPYTKDPVMPQEEPKLSFCDLMDLNDLSEIACFNEKDIKDLVEKEPDFAILLIQDLRDELFFKRNAEKAKEKAKNVITLESQPINTEMKPQTWVN